MGIITKNRKLGLYGSIIQKSEAGMVLKGWEVKSIRHRRVEIDGAFILITNERPFLTGIKIFPLTSLRSLELLQQNRRIELLLHSKEVHRLRGIIKQNNLTAIPSSLYIKSGYIKCEIAVVEGRKRFEKEIDNKRQGISPYDFLNPIS